MSARRKFDDAALADPLLAELRKQTALLERIAEALRVAVECNRKPARPLKHRDREAMQKIIPVLVCNFEGAFSAWEVTDAAEQKDMLGANLRIVLGKRTSQELGLLFGRAAGHDIGGHRLRRVGENGSGALWECGGT